MRDEPWMHTIIRTQTPLQIARNDLAYWKEERERASARMRECTDKIADALDRIEKHTERT